MRHPSGPPLRREAGGYAGEVRWVPRGWGRPSGPGVLRAGLSFTKSCRSATEAASRERAGSGRRQRVASGELACLVIQATLSPVVPDAGGRRCGYHQIPQPPTCTDPTNPTGHDADESTLVRPAPHWRRPHR
jgi:hypothetical protein